jgi:membrane-bound metal-dependent hydrolase YbcI (DUF457 family)
MMGRTHAVTGAAAWQVGCLIAATEGYPPDAYVVIVGTALCAFGALVPDIDMPASRDGKRPGSLVAQSLGVVTQGIAYGVARYSARVHRNSRSKYDRPNENGHRALTHTIPFCAAMLILFGSLGQYGGTWAPLVVVFWAAATAARAALPAKSRSVLVGRVFSRLGKRTATAARSASLWNARKTARFWRRWSKAFKRLAWLTGRVRVPIAPGVGAAVVLAMWWWPAPSGWWMGYAIGAGCLLHCLGDSLTHYGTPLLWPWPVRGQVWYPVRPRLEWRFTTGGRTREETDEDGTVRVISEDRVEEYVLGYSALAALVSGGFVAYLAWWPTVLSWTTAVQGWWPGS